jgi:radical SAM protein with 4Fe4S-binding SPASM domain
MERREAAGIHTKPFDEESGQDADMRGLRRLRGGIGSKREFGRPGGRAAGTVSHMKSQIKPIAGMERVKLAEAIPLPAPFTVFIFPTTFCNFRCVYCGHSLGSEGMRQRYGIQPRHMEEDVFAAAVRQIQGFGQKLKLISLTGHGEPLLHPRIAEMVETVGRAGIAERIEIISNASLLTGELADKLVAAGLNGLRVSVQGVTDDQYRDICGTHVSFAEIVENLTYFYRRKKRCQLFVKTMDIALKDEKQEALFYKTFESISDRMYVEKCRPVYSGVKATEGVETTADRYGRAHPPRIVCPLCFYMLGIFPDGDVAPCDAIYKPVILGNIREATLKSMWEGERLREFRLTQLNNARYSNEKCAVCCAADDVAHPEDQLDEYREELKQRL